MVRRRSDRIVSVKGIAYPEEEKGCQGVREDKRTDPLRRRKTEAMSWKGTRKETGGKIK